MRGEREWLRFRDHPISLASVSSLSVIAIDGPITTQLIGDPRMVSAEVLLGGHLAALTAVPELCAAERGGTLMPQLCPASRVRARARDREWWAFASEGALSRSGPIIDEHDAASRGH